jgi:hypothetical protein
MILLRWGVAPPTTPMARSARPTSGASPPRAPTLSFFSVIICDGNQTINNYSSKNTVTPRGGAPSPPHSPVAWWAAQRPLVHRAEPSVVGGATPPGSSGEAPSVAGGATPLITCILKKVRNERPGAIRASF